MYGGEQYKNMKLEDTDCRLGKTESRIPQKRTGFLLCHILSLFVLMTPLSQDLPSSNFS